MDDDALKANLVDLEKEGWDSLCDGTGAEFYGKLMTEDAVMVLANGMVMDRQTVVESLEHATPWRTYSIDDVHLVATGSDGASLVYQGTAFREEDEPLSSALCPVCTAASMTPGE